MQTDALTKYLIYQLYSARMNLQRVSATADTEFLHQCRVALRRCRSLVQLYIPDSAVIEDRIKSIFKPTSLLRELDVLLLSLKEDDCPELYRQLQYHRVRTYNSVITQEYIERNSRLLEMLIDDLLSINMRHTDKWLVKKTLSQFRKSKSAYQKLAPDAKQKKLHKLRIEFKTARYALEFLQESGRCQKKGKIKYTKKRQDELGSLQDAYNQLKLLQQFCRKHETDECRELCNRRKKEYKSLVRRAKSNLSD